MCQSQSYFLVRMSRNIKAEVFAETDEETEEEKFWRLKIIKSKVKQLYKEGYKKSEICSSLNLNMLSDSTFYRWVKQDYTHTHKSRLPDWLKNEKTFVEQSRLW